MSKKVIAIIVLIFILIALPLTIYLVKREQEIRMRAAPATNLSINPPSITKNVGDTFTIQIVIDTGTNVVVATDFDISFDPQILEATNISPGDFFSSPTETHKSINNISGNILYALNSFTPQSGSGNVASIVFNAKTAGRSTISFGPRTGVYASEGESVLDQTSPGSVEIITTEETPTRTGTPSNFSDFSDNSTPSPSPTPTRISAAGGTAATSTPTKTPTPTPTRTSTSSSETLVPTSTKTSTPRPTSTSQELPKSGIVNPTFILMGGGILALISGLLLLF